MFATALADSAAIVGVMSESFCVNPDQLADSEMLGVYAPVAARTPQRAAPSRARTALSAGFCCSAIVSRSPSRHGRVGGAQLGVLQGDLRDRLPVQRPVQEQTVARRQRRHVLREVGGQKALLA